MTQKEIYKVKQIKYQTIIADHTKPKKKSLFLYTYGRSGNINVLPIKFGQINDSMLSFFTKTRELFLQIAMFSVFFYCT